MAFSPTAEATHISSNIRAYILSNSALFYHSETASSNFKLFSNNNMNANENQMPVDVLQPEISGQIKQTTLEELKNWIKDGKLQPHHQVE